MMNHLGISSFEFRVSNGKLRLLALAGAGIRAFLGLVAPASIYVAAWLLVLTGGRVLADSAATAKAVSKGTTNAAATNLPAAPGGTSTVASPSLPISMDTLDDKHTLAIGDVVSYRVVEDDDPAMKLIVTDSGDLEIPLAKGENGAVQLLGRYPVLGKTCKGFAWVLKGDLEKDYYKKATVILAIDAMSHTRGRIWVLGAVRAPGPQEIPSDEEFTLSKAILRAGGLAEYAARTVRITRKGPKGVKDDQQIYVNIEKILQQGKHEGDITLQADDYVFVDERSIRGF